ncbi:hypothetical protein HY493_01565 [Candidatus Woesearchaeota archaeon]|nr:hypothetical protein [Candidatus Woesearchaeota archaeon]
MVALFPTAGGWKMTVDDVCALTVRKASRELSRHAKELEFGDEFVQSQIGYGPNDNQDGHALSAMFVLSGIYLRCRELAQYLHEETSCWDLWKRIMQNYRELKERWMPA